MTPARSFELHPIIIINHGCDPSLVHLPGLTGRAGFAYRYAAALARGTIDRFDDTGAAVPFGGSADAASGATRPHRTPAGRCRTNNGGGSGAAVLAPTAGPGPRRAGPRPGPRRADQPAPRSARTKPCAFCGLQTSTSHRVRAPPTAASVPVSAATGPAAAGPTRLFLAGQRSIVRATSGTRTMLRWELRSTKSLATCACCAALATDAGTNRAWLPPPLHGYLACPWRLPLGRTGSLPQAAHQCCIVTMSKNTTLTLN